LGDGREKKGNGDRKGKDPPKRIGLGIEKKDQGRGELVWVTEQKENGWWMCGARHLSARQKYEGGEDNKKRKKKKKKEKEKTV